MHSAMQQAAQLTDCRFPGGLQDKLPWAEEVLITKSELDEKKARTAELEQMVLELTMQGEYKLRLKDLHMQVRAHVAKVGARAGQGG